MISMQVFFDTSLDCNGFRHQFSSLNCQQTQFADAVFERTFSLVPCQGEIIMRLGTYVRNVDFVKATLLCCLLCCGEQFGCLRRDHNKSSTVKAKLNMTKVGAMKAKVIISEKAFAYMYDSSAYEGGTGKILCNIVTSGEQADKCLQINSTQTASLRLPLTAT